jgi:hypothetical protein
VRLTNLHQSLRGAVQNHVTREDGGALTTPSS